MSLGSIDYWYNEKERLGALLERYEAVGDSFSWDEVYPAYRTACDEYRAAVLAHAPFTGGHVLMCDVFDSRQYRIRYSIGKSKDVHEILLIAFDIVEARQAIIAKHRDGLLYPPLSAYNPLKIVSIVDVS